ncbi:MAG: hypothetical protein ACE5EX_02550 [Phycisphaerae bacterium]
MADDKARAAEPKSDARARLVPAVIVIMMMGLEGVGVFFLAKAINPDPVPTLAGEPVGEGNGASASEQDEFGEVELAECRPSNSVSGKFITFHLRVAALVASSDVERVKKMIRSRKARIEDSVSTVIRSAEPAHLSEPGRETLKRRLKLAVDQILGDDQIIKAILIPQMLQSGGGV